jgi:hypothetical protein
MKPTTARSSDDNVQLARSGVSRNSRRLHSRRARRQHVEVRQTSSVAAASMERPARFHQRHVERPAVERHEQAGVFEHAAQRLEHRSLARRRAQKELTHAKRARPRTSRSRRETAACRRRR